MEESFVDPTQPQAPTQAAQGPFDPNFTADITRRMQVFLFKYLFYPSYPSFQSYFHLRLIL